MNFDWLETADDDEWNQVLAKYYGESFVKLARKRAKDPIQEHLRQSKDEWNKYVSKFIETLKALKKGVNGYPVPVVGINDKSKITEPLPQSIPALIDHLAQEYLNVTNQAKRIVNEQTEYARHHEESHKDKSEADDLLFSKEASNRLTRMWSHIKTPFQLGDKDRWVRKNLLVATVEVETLLEKLDDIILSKKSNSILESVALCDKLYRNINDGIISTVNKVKRAREKANINSPELQKEPVIEPAVSSPSTDNVSSPSNLSEDVAKMEATVQSMHSDLRKLQINMAGYPDNIKNEITKSINEMDQTIQRFKSALKDKNLDVIKAEYKLLSEQSYKLTELIKQKTAEFTPNTELQKLARSSIGRWLKRKRLSIFSTISDNMKLSISDNITDAINIIDSLQNLLEKSGFNITDIEFKTQKLKTALGNIFAGIYALADAYNTDSRLMHTGKDKPQIIQQTEINKLKRMAVGWGANVT